MEKDFANQKETKLLLEKAHAKEIKLLVEQTEEKLESQSKMFKERE